MGKGIKMVLTGHSQGLGELLLVIKELLLLHLSLVHVHNIEKSDKTYTVCKLLQDPTVGSQRQLFF